MPLASEESKIHAYNVIFTNSRINPFSILTYIGKNIEKKKIENGQ